MANNLMYSLSHMGGMFGPSFLLLVLASIITMIASANVNSTFKKYAKIGCARGTTGAQAARAILDANGLHHVQVLRTNGKLTDYFDPRSNTVNLSDSTYDVASIGAVGVAAHECGHAIQYAVSYGPIKFRNSLVPVVNFTNWAAIPLLLIGLVLGMTNLAWLGLILYSFVLIFQIATLPVEFNASNRALEILESTNMLVGEENKGAKKVLSAAAMTYVAAVAATSLQVLRFALMILGSGSNRRRR